MDVNLKPTKRLINHVAKEEGQYLYGHIMLSPLLQLQWVLFLASINVCATIVTKKVTRIKKKMVTKK